jgi:hypothetical protein
MLMRSREPFGLSISMVGAVVAAGIFLTAHAARADDGDERCSKNGHLWVDDVETRAWEDTNGACAPLGALGSPANGDKRCGISGFTVKYVAKIDGWQNTHTPCHSGGATAGVHLENLHSGTEPAVPFGWSGVHSPGPSTPN